MITFLRAFGLVTLALAGCAHVTNSSLCGQHGSGLESSPCNYDPSPDTSYRFAPRRDRDTLVIVTFSGGGTRAAALAFGTLEALADLKGTQEGSSLLDEVSLISSVSGGSVTAGWYALNGAAGLQQPDEPGTMLHFLNGDWTAKLVWKGLNPVSLMRYAFTPYTRSDVLADFFASHLYDHSTYADVLKHYKADATQPYIILNATDIGHETVFPFTQGRFDFLCSDLLHYRLADAVAASANFPLAFSPLGLKNFSGCPAQSSPTWTGEGPPQWVEHYHTFDQEEAPTSHSYALSQLRAARLANDYLKPTAVQPPDQYVHLLDGGVGDNLGVRSTLALEDDPARVPGLYLRLGAPRPEGYQNIKRVLYIVVNARARDPGSIDQQKRPPGEIRTALRMVDTQLDNSTLADQDFLISELEATAHRAAHSAMAAPLQGQTQECLPVSQTAPAQEPSDAPFLSRAPSAQARCKAPSSPLQFYVASVDFEMIPNKDCRDRYWHLKTNWGLKRDQVEGLRKIARVILSRSPDLADFYRDLHQPAPERLDFNEVCTLVGH